MTASATAEAAARTVLDGIAIDVPNPPHYLEALWLGLRLACPDDAGVGRLIGEIEGGLGYRPEVTVRAEAGPYPAELYDLIGWSGDRILHELVDREWLLTDKNEFAPLTGILERTETLAAATRLFLCAAGACRLGAHLAERAGVEAVECTDLSFFGLYCGRLLIAGRADRLPEGLRRPRIVLSVAPDGASLRGRKETPAFHRPAAAAALGVSFRVTDAFALPRPVPGDTVLVPHLLDVFDPQRMITALIRICEALTVGQRLLLVTTLNSQRHPVGLLRAARATGLEVRRLHLHELPYSLSPYGYGFVRRVFNTLIVEAVKSADTDRSAISATLEPVDPEAGSQLAGRSQRPYELTPRQAAAVRRAVSLTGYRDLARSLDDALGAALSRRFASYQCARGGLRLKPREAA